MQKVFMINANILNFFYKPKFDSSRQNFTDVQEVTLIKTTESCQTQSNISLQQEYITNEVRDIVNPR